MNSNNKEAKTRNDWLQAMPKNYVDQSRLCVIAVETFIREIGKLSEAKQDPYIKAYTQKMLFEMHIKKQSFIETFLL